jgi:hypothetical protein
MPTAKDRDQLLVQMLDYVRSTNLHDDLLSPGPFFNASTTKETCPQFTNGRKTNTDLFAWAGHGQVPPIRVPENFADSLPASDPDKTSHMGFGRFVAISEAGLLFLCGADGTGFKINGADPSLDQCAKNKTIRDANDAKLLSNQTANKMTGGSLLKGEAFLDIGIGAAPEAPGTPKPAMANSIGTMGRPPLMDVSGPTMAIATSSHGMTSMATGNSMRVSPITTPMAMGNTTSSPTSRSTTTGAKITTQNPPG